MRVCLDQMTGDGCSTKNRDGARFCKHCGRSLRFALQLHDPDTMIGPYRIKRVLGHGGFGAVYEAQNVRRAGQPVALKETFDPNSIYAFRSEFKVLSDLRHPHLPLYYDMFTLSTPSDYGNSEKGYLVMELVPGQNLEEIVEKQQGPLLEAQVLGYALQLCDALTYLHSQEPPILHRDIKPANVRLTPEGLIKLVDFGLVKQERGKTVNAQRGLTPEYASLEQWSGGTDARSDIYSLGATLYHLLTAQAPIPATNRLMKRPNDPLPAPRELNPRLSPIVANALTEAMELFPQDRHQSATAMKHALIGSGMLVASPTASIAPAPVDQNPLPPPESPPPPPINANLLSTLNVGTRLFGVTFSTNGQQIAMGGNDGTLEVWDVNAEQKSQSFQGHNGRVFAVAFRPERRRQHTSLLASAGEDQKIYLWDVATGKQIGQFMGHTDWVRGVAFSPDGQVLASAAYDGTVRLWDIALGREIGQFGGHGSFVYSIAFSPDGSLLAAGDETSIRLWNVMTMQAEEEQHLKGHRDRVMGVAFHADGKRLLSGSFDKTVRLWNLTDGKNVWQSAPHPNQVMGVAISPNGRFTASGAFDKTVRLWDSAHQWQPHTLTGHIGNVSSVAFSPTSSDDLPLLASAASDGTVRLWKINPS